MIKIYYMYEKFGIWYEDYIIFWDVKKALRFLYATAKKYVIISWETENPEDNNYLNYKFRPEKKR